MKRTARRKWWLVLILLLMAVYVAWAINRPLPRLQPSASSAILQVESGPDSLVWPADQAAAGIVGSSILQTHGPIKPAPTASTAKIITALMVLRQKPLSAGQQGPTITLSAADKAILDAYTAHGGSVVPVLPGEKITEYQMLEAMLLPSANNMADSLAIWSYGSLQAYASAANSYLKQLGLGGTTIGTDASGYSPTTTSTAHDLVRLGEIVMQKPVLAEIVNKNAATDIPLAPNAKNVNFLLGSSGIIGIKTGNTDQAGGVYVSAARTTINQKPVTIVTALMGAPTLFDSVKFSLPLIQSAEANFTPVTVVKAGSVMGRYKQPWGGTIPAVASRDLGITTWKGSQIFASVNLPPINSSIPRDNVVSVLTIADPATGTKKSIPIKLGSSPTKPTIWWRLKHP